jgi:hypothetical protein
MKLYLPSTWSDGSPINDRDEGDTMELTDRQVIQIEETHDTVVQLKTVLLGANGNPGLVTKVEKSCERQDALEKRFWYLVGTLAGLGLISGGILGLLKLV